VNLAPPTDAEAWPSRRVRLLALGVLALLWLPALLRGGWALDDRELLFGNPVVDGSLPWSAAFTRDYFHHLGDVGQWRPLASLSLRLDRWLFGESVLGYHLVNGALHLAVVAAALALLRRLEVPARVAFLGLGLFALHPALVDSVVWIAGRTSMLAALFPLLGALGAEAAWSRGRATWVGASTAAAGLGLGLLAKEDALVFAPGLVLLAARRGRGQGWATAVAVLVVSAACFGGRALVFGELLPKATTPALGSADLPARLEAGGLALVEALRLALLPLDHPPQYRLELLLRRAEPAPPWLVAGLGWALWLTPFALLIFVRGAARRLAPWAAALAALACLPLTQLVPIGELFAPRFLYLPLLFAAPVTGMALARLCPRRRAAAGVLSLGVVLLLTTLTTRRAGIYASRGAWRAEVLRHQPGDAPSWNDLGLLHEEEGDVAGARAAWRRAIELDPRYSKGWSNLGRVQLEAGETEAAEASLRAALAAGPRNPVPRLNLAILETRRGRHAEAAELYRAAARLSPGLASAWRGLAGALLELDQRAEAEAAWERARGLDPDHPAAHTLRRRLDAARREP